MNPSRDGVAAAKAKVLSAWPDAFTGHCDAGWYVWSQSMPGFKALSKAQPSEEAAWLSAASHPTVAVSTEKEETRAEVDSEARNYARFKRSAPTPVASPEKRKKSITHHSTTDCRTEDGITVGLIDAMISIGRVLAPRLPSGYNPDNKAVIDALADMSSDSDLEKILQSHHLILADVERKYPVKPSSPSQAEPQQDCYTRMCSCGHELISHAVSGRCIAGPLKCECREFREAEPQQGERGELLKKLALLREHIVNGKQFTALSLLEQVTPSLLSTIAELGKLREHAAAQPQQPAQSLHPVSDEDLVRFYFELGLDNDGLVYEKKKDGIEISVPSMKYKALALKIAKASAQQSPKIEWPEKLVTDEQLAYRIKSVPDDWEIFKLARELQSYRKIREKMEGED